MSDCNLDMAETIARLPGLGSLPPDRLHGLASMAALESIQEGQTFYREDDQGLDVYYLVSGLVEGRMRIPSSGHDDSFRVLKSGSWFGETSFLDGGRRGSTLAARERSLVVRLDGTALRTACERDPVLGRAVYAALGRVAAMRVRDTALELRNAVGSY